MNRQNRDGRPIFSETTWQKLLDSGRKLAVLGCMESLGKPNLFSRTIDKGILYADMQGTEVVPIWDAPCPYLYFYPKNGTTVSADEKRVILKTEFVRLKEGGCQPRFSFYDIHEPDGLFCDDQDVSDWCD